MRLFVAAPLPAETLQMLEEIVRELEKLEAEVRWARTASMHLTLKFLGWVQEDRIPRLEAALAESAAGHAPLRLTAARLGSFPERGSPRVVWFGIADPDERLARLQADVERACGPLGFPPEDRPYHAHLTLGRVSGKRNIRPLAERIRIGSERESTFAVDHINLYQSTLRPSGAVYTVLRELPLAAP